MFSLGYLRLEYCEYHNGWLSEPIFIVKLQEEEIKLKYVHLITNYVILIYTQYIRTENTPWNTEWDFTVFWVKNLEFIREMLQMLYFKNNILKDCLNI